MLFRFDPHDRWNVEPATGHLNLSAAPPCEFPCTCASTNAQSSRRASRLRRLTARGARVSGVQPEPSRLGLSSQADRPTAPSTRCPENANTAELNTLDVDVKRQPTRGDSGDSSAVLPLELSEPSGGASASARQLAVAAGSRSSYCICICSSEASSEVAWRRRASTMAMAEATRSPRSR